MSELSLVKVPDLNAKPTDGRIGVHVLTEFVFCPRAGLCAYESQDWRSDDDEPLPASYLPSYELRDIEAALATLLNDVGKLAVYGLLGFAVAALLTWFVHRDAAFFGIAWFAWFGGFALVKLRAAWILAVERKQFESAVAREPDFTVASSQPVQWWELIKAGFEPIVCKEPLVHEDWRLAGKPWRVLRRGSLRIPVWRLRSQTDPRTIRRQHLVRMAAYCHLVQTSEGADSPYGVILFGDSYEGMAIPNSAENRKAFTDALTDARVVIQSVKNNMEPMPPQDGAPCRGCPFGEPVKEAAGKVFARDAFALPVFVAADTEGKTWHCHCGDRFRWLPPHADSLLKGLRILG